MTPIAHSLQAWATAYGMERRTLEARLVKSGWVAPTTKRGFRIPARQILNALLGDKEAETIRNLKADADRKERENKVAARELITMDEAKSVLREALEPARQRIVSLPAEMAARCNPTDPEFARIALEGWRDDALRFCETRTRNEQP